MGLKISVILLNIREQIKGQDTQISQISFFILRNLYIQELSIRYLQEGKCERKGQKLYSPLLFSPLLTHSFRLYLSLKVKEISRTSYIQTETRDNRLFSLLTSIIRSV